MANLKSSKKDVRRIKRRTERNNDRRGTVDVLYRKLVKEVKAKKKEVAEETQKEYYKAVDKAAKSGIFKKNKAARKKAQAAKLVAAISSKK